MNAQRISTVMSMYLREISGGPDLPLPRDIKEEQAKINRANGLVFIYPNIVE